MADLLLNLGTELIGIVVTIWVVDRLLERRKLRDDARRIAREARHELDHHVWVWQGGARDFHLSELLSLNENVHDDDPLPSFTQYLFLLLGSRASNTLRTRTDVVAVSRDLKAGLDELANLAAMRDNDAHLPPVRIARHLSTAVRPLARAAELTIPAPTTLAPPEYRRTSMKQQEWRHYGTSIEPDSRS